MPANGFYFDNLTRTPEFDEDEADPADNVADYMLVSDEQIAFHKKVMEEVKGNGRAIQVDPCYAGLGDANNIPGPNLKHPKGIRDISEWYMAPLLYPDYVHEVFDRGTDIAIQNFKRYWDEFGSDIDILFLCGTDFGTQRGPFMDPEVFKEFYLPYYKKMTDWGTHQYHMEDSETFLRRYLPDSSVSDRGRNRRDQPGTVLCRGNGSRRN